MLYENMKQKWQDWCKSTKRKPINFLFYGKLFTLIAMIMILLIYLFIVPNTTPNMDDIGFIREGGWVTLNGYNPYATDIRETNYPPGYFYLYAVIISLFGDSITTLRTSVIIATFANSFIVFIITKTLIKQFTEKLNMSDAKKISDGGSTKLDIVVIAPDSQWFNLMPYVTATLYLWDLSVIGRTAGGNNDAFAVFFLLIGVYLFFIDKELCSAISFSFSLLIKIIPLFIFPLIAIRFIKRKEWKKGIIFFLIVAITCLLVSLRFLIDDFWATFNGITSLLNQASRAATYAWFMPALYNIVEIGPFTVSYWFFIQVILYLLLIIVLSKGDQNKNDLMIGFIIIIFALPVLTNCKGGRYLSWMAPLLYILILSRKEYKLCIRIFIFEKVLGILYGVSIDNILIGKELIQFDTLWQTIIMWIPTILMFLWAYSQTYLIIRELLKLKNNFI